jgi:hypothetical protein
MESKIYKKFNKMEIQCFNASNVIEQCSNKYDEITSSYPKCILAAVMLEDSKDSKDSKKINEYYAMSDDNMTIDEKNKLDRSYDYFSDFRCLTYKRRIN